MMATTNKTLRENLVALECKNPVKDTSAYKYKYAQLDQVTEIVSAACKEVGLSWRQGVKRYAKDDYTLQTIVFDKSEEVVLDERAYMQYGKPQEQGSYDTYTRRYALLCAFGLAPEDDDGAAASNAKQPKQNDKRQAMVQRIDALKSECIENGVRPESLSEWLVAKYHTSNLNELNEGALVEYGKHLSQVAKDSGELIA